MRKSDVIAEHTGKFTCAAQLLCISFFSRSGSWCIPSCGSARPERKPVKKDIFPTEIKKGITFARIRCSWHELLQPGPHGREEKPLSLQGFGYSRTTQRGRLPFLFGLPFLLAGLFVMQIPLGLIPMEGSPGPLPSVFVVLFGSVFAAVGAGLVFGRSGIIMDRGRGRVVQWWGLLVPMKRRSTCWMRSGRWRWTIQAATATPPQPGPLSSPARGSQSPSPLFSP